jgi:hypothetical protein
MEMCWIEVVMKFHRMRDSVVVTMMIGLLGLLKDMEVC